MNDEARLLMLIWESMGDFISTGDKQDAADALVGTLVEWGHELEALYDADGECPYIDKALTSLAASDEHITEEEDWDR